MEPIEGMLDILQVDIDGLHRSRVLTWQKFSNVEGDFFGPFYNVL